MVTTTVVPGAMLVETTALCGSEDGADVMEDDELVVAVEEPELELELELL
jgi:hypothetical protein